MKQLTNDQKIAFAYLEQTNEIARKFIDNHPEIFERWENGDVEKSQLYMEGIIDDRMIMNWFLDNYEMNL